MNHYETLRVSTTASDKDIQDAYNAIAIQTHPDKHPGREEEFRRATAAYNVLRNKRKEYDEEQARFKKISRVRGKDLQINLKIKQAEVGKPKQVNTSRMAPCTRCDGTGSSIRKSKKCPSCGGSGLNPVSMVFGPKELCRACKGLTKIPEGDACPSCFGSGLYKEFVQHSIVPDPSTNPLVISKAGNYLGGIAGNLIINMVFEESERFRIKGLDLYTSLKISPAQAVLGDKVRIEVTGQFFLIDIPSGTEHGTTITKAKAGLSGKNKKGDLYIKVALTTPPIDEKTRPFYKKILEIEKRKEDGGI